MKSLITSICVLLFVVTGCKTTKQNSGTLSVAKSDPLPSGLAVTSEKIFRANLEDQIANFEKGGVETPISLFCQTLALLYLTKGEFAASAM